MTDLNNNPATDFDNLTPDNVEEELARLKLFDLDYRSDEDERDKVRLTGKGIDFNALKAGQDIEFQIDDKDEDNYNWEDENDDKIDYEKVFRYRNLAMVTGYDNENECNDETEDSNTNVKTPFEILKLKMFDITADKDQGVLKRVLVPGSGLVIPNGSRVRIHYNAYFEMNDEPFDSTHLRNKTFEFKLGANQVVLGLEVALSTMRKHEKSQFIFQPEYYCGKFGCEPRVPRETPVLFEVEVISFIEANAYDQFELTPEEQRQKLTLPQMLQICNCLRQLGNDNYQRLNFKDASKKYRKAIYLLENISVTDEDEERWKSVMLKLYLNMSQVCLKQTKPKKAIYYCKMALEIDEKNVKALYRYGQSLRILQDFDRSRKFLNKAYELSPTSQEIVQEIEKLNDMIAKYKIIEKDFYKKAFNIKEDATKDTDTGTREWKMDEKESLTKSKELIQRKLKEFREDEKMTIYNIQLNMYSLNIINYIISEAESMNLTIRTIKGPENIMQIMKKVA